jgi:hypothetical protein
VIISDVLTLPPFAILPPTDYIFEGFGFPAESPVIITLPPPSPYVALPPQDYVIPGFGYPAQPAVLYKAAPADYVPLPPTDYVIAGYGQPAQPSAIFIGVPAPAEILPPQDYIFAGYGFQPEAPIIIPAIPPPQVPLLPPPQYVLAGYGFPAQLAQIIEAFDSRAPYPTVTPELVVGYGVAAEPPVIIPAIPPPQVPLLPPPTFVLAGYGFPAQLAQIIPAVPPPVAELPPLDSIFAGFGKPPALAYLYVQPPAPYVSLPPIPQLVEGFNPPQIVFAPVAQRPISAIVARFLYGTLFPPRALQLFVYVDDHGRQFATGPHSVTFTLYMKQEEFLHQVGPSNRAPASAAVGEFYVTGTVGEGGQPGTWMIRWTVQEVFNGPVFTRDYYFEVTARGGPSREHQEPGAWISTDRRRVLPSGETAPPRPVHAPPRPVVREFRWQQVFVPGDLDIQIRDLNGNTIDPSAIGYTLYQREPGGSLRQVGQQGKRPVKADVGRYYVVGSAGEGGQPGEWVIVWSYQLTPQTAVITRERTFRVGGTPGRGTDGWS